MVLYHANGRVVKAHEDYLEQAAQKQINIHHYDDQAVIAKKKDAKDAGEKKKRVYLRVGEQYWRELYENADSGLVPNLLKGFDQETQSELFPPGGLDRMTLMGCSSLADEYFTFNPGKTELRLPVDYPRWHLDYKNRYASADKYEIAGEKFDPEIKDGQMAYIREREIAEYIIPWLKEMERVLGKKTKTPIDKLPAIELPEHLLEMIHLYNAMLQLGIASHFQRQLVDELILRMYQTNLSHCHLDTLEMTVCRFYSRGIAILDPVINHFVGTYFLRSAADRANSLPPDDLIILREATSTEDDREVLEKYLIPGTTRDWLEYKNVKPDLREKYPDDTISLPPRLEVLGHCIRHWSGVRRNGSTAAAHTGYPLNVGRVFKYYRRRPTDAVRPKQKNGGNARRNIDYADYSTYRLKKSEYFQNNPPGNITPPAPAPPPVPDPESEE
jgi:hypothetical protein